MKTISKILLIMVILTSMLGYTVYASSSAGITDLTATNVKALKQSKMLTDCTYDLGEKITGWQNCDDGNKAYTFTRDYACWGGGESCNPRTVLTVYSCDGNSRVSTTSRLGFCD